MSHPKAMNPQADAPSTAKTRDDDLLDWLPRWLVAAVFLATGGGFAHAQENKGKSASPSFMVRFTTEMIEVSTATCDALTAEAQTSLDDTDLRHQLRTLTALGQAVLLDTATVTTRPGEPARSESHREDVYLSEPDPDGLPSISPVREFLPGQAALSSLCVVETRNVGIELGVDFTTQDNGKFYHGSYTLERVGRHSDSIFAKWTKPGFEIDVKSPTFYSLRLKSQTLLIAGVPTRVGILSPKGPDGLPDPTRKVIVFLRAETLVVPP